MTLVDSNVILDIVGADPIWRKWSVTRLDEARAAGDLAVNGVIYAEIAPRFADERRLDAFLADAGFSLLAFSRAQMFAAGRAHRSYRRRGGERRRVLPDFMIGAQASVVGASLLTRDVSVFRTYFPDVGLITP